MQASNMRHLGNIFFYEHTLRVAKTVDKPNCLQMTHHVKTKHFATSQLQLGAGWMQSSIATAKITTARLVSALKKWLH
jgi:hypothetical protein